jgi:hypothetical protein
MTGKDSSEIIAMVCAMAMVVIIVIAALVEVIRC